MKDPFRITFAVLLWGFKFICHISSYAELLAIKGVDCTSGKQDSTEVGALFLGMQRNSRHIQKSINLASIVRRFDPQSC